MANTTQVFVSPGVYTSEKDLTFVAQSVGVTTLGLVGETLQGPAFEPVLISSYGEFQTYFGGVSPTKYIETQIPKYELGYIAKSYLSQSNQLFVTRVLGLSGYDAGPSWTITSIGQLDGASIDYTGCSTYTQGAHPDNTGMPITNVGASSSAVTFVVSGGTAYSGVGITDYGLSFYSMLPPYLKTRLYSPITKYNGSVTTLKSDLDNFFSSLAGQGSGESTNLMYQYGCLSGCSYTGSSMSSGLTYNDDSISSNVNLWGNHGPSAMTTSNRLNSACGGSGGTPTTYTEAQNDPWTYAYFDYIEPSVSFPNGQYHGVSFSIYTSGLTQLSTLSQGGNMSVPNNTTTVPIVTGLSSGNISVFSGYANVDISVFSGTPLTEYHNQVIATLRSRGVSSLASGGPDWEISAHTYNYVYFDCTGSSYTQITSDPYANFGIDVTASTTSSKSSYDVSLKTTNRNYIANVFGTSVWDKDKDKYPLFVEEVYPNLLNKGYNENKIRGIRCGFLELPSVQADTSQTTIAYYMEKWQTPATPYVVSELRGIEVFDLFRFILVSDGDAANRLVKISIININPDTLTFDVIVRDFYDSDSSVKTLEKFTRCTMNPSLNSYVGKKIGTSDGEYELNSSYIMLELNSDHPTDTVPAGFKGYDIRTYQGYKSPVPLYKTYYYVAGDVTADPPFGASNNTSNQLISSGDKVRQVYLGISNTVGIDVDFFDYKGKKRPADVCNATVGLNWPYITQGFHMDSGATSIKSVILGVSGTSTYQVGNADFKKSMGIESPYYKTNSRKFTLLPYAGFDGWDRYRKTRSNTDNYILGQAGFKYGACSTNYAGATGQGIFKKTGTNLANTDYYAFLQGIETYQNPEAVDINVFATPGIDYVNNSNLVEEAIDMVETDRADSLYVTTTPDYNLYATTPNDVNEIISPTEAVDNLENSGIDSNYTATYYPWVQFRDQESNVQIYLPPTYDVMRNIALTDNISFPWFASAGYTRGLVNAVKARKKLTLTERDTLYRGRLNPIATFSDVGTIIWGNKTLQSKESALDRINVRRLLLQARKLISAVAVRLLFEQNDEQVRNEFLDLVNPILDSIRKERGLTDFRVTVSDDPELIDQNTLEGKIYIKPTRSLEFIDIEFLITPTGASFEDI